MDSSLEKFQSNSEEKKILEPESRAVRLSNSMAMIQKVQST